MGLFVIIAIPPKKLCASAPLRETIKLTVGKFGELNELHVDNPNFFLGVINPKRHD